MRWAFLLLVTHPVGAQVVDAGMRSLTSCALDQLASRSADDVWLADRCGHFFRSADGGDHWRVAEGGPARILPSGQRLIAALWLSEFRGLFVSASGTFARTTDGGKT